MFQQGRTTQQRLRACRAHLNGSLVGLLTTWVMDTKLSRAGCWQPDSSSTSSH
jgi:hypothetical protein